MRTEHHIPGPIGFVSPLFQVESSVRLVGVATVPPRAECVTTNSVHFATHLVPKASRPTRSRSNFRGMCHLPADWVRSVTFPHASPTAPATLPPVTSPLVPSPYSFFGGLQ